ELEPVQDLASFGAEWDGLAERHGSFFGTPEWLTLWWKHFGGGRELLLTAGRGADGRLEALLPFYVWRTRPLRVVRVLGHGPGDVLGSIGERAAAGAALARWAAEERFDVLGCQQPPGWDVRGGVPPG